MNEASPSFTAPQAPLSCQSMQCAAPGWTSHDGLLPLCASSSRTHPHRTGLDKIPTGSQLAVVQVRVDSPACQVWPVRGCDEVAEPLVRDLVADDVCSTPHAVRALSRLQHSPWPRECAAPGPQLYSDWDAAAQAPPLQRQLQLSSRQAAAPCGRSTRRVLRGHTSLTRKRASSKSSRPQFSMAPPAHRRRAHQAATVTVALCAPTSRRAAACQGAARQRTRHAGACALWGRQRAASSQQARLCRGRPPCRSG